MIRLVCGYKRTGKDTLVKMFNGTEDFKWIVYKHPTNTNHFHIEPTERVGFADKLRTEVDVMLKLDTQSVDYDTYKEVVVKDGKTYRDFLIDHAAVRRAENIDYWVSRAKNWDELYSDNKIMITDWRYPNELTYLKQFDNLNVVTIRLFRSDVPIPPDDMISEHQLDKISTDYLLVNSDLEFENACKIFPQYKDYVKVDVCNSKCYVQTTNHRKIQDCLRAVKEDVSRLCLENLALITLDVLRPHVINFYHDMEELIRLCEISPEGIRKQGNLDVIKQLRDHMRGWNDHDLALQFLLLDQLVSTIENGEVENFLKLRKRVSELARQEELLLTPK